MRCVINLLIHKLLVLLWRENLLQLGIDVLHVLHGLGAGIADSSFKRELEVHTVQGITHDAILNIQLTH